MTSTSSSSSSSSGFSAALSPAPELPVLPSQLPPPAASSAAASPSSTPASPSAHRDKPSDVWAHFVKGSDGYNSCGFMSASGSRCGQRVKQQKAGTTTNMREHLARMHKLHLSSRTPAAASASASGAAPQRRPLLLDSKLLPRISAYLQSAPGADVSVDDIVAHLRTKYQQYARKPYKGFLSQVSRLCERERQKAAGGKAESAAEEKAADGQRKRRRRESSIEGKDDSDDAMESDASSDEEVELLDEQRTGGNIVNSAMRALYRTNTQEQQQQAAPSPSQQQPLLPAALSSPPAVAPLPPAPLPSSSSPPPAARVGAINNKKQRRYRTQAAIASSLSSPSSYPSSSSDSWRPTFLTSSLSYSDLGGIESVLQDIRELIHYPLSHPELYSHLGVAPPLGVLLHGVPGSGKTMLSMAIAGEVGRMGVRCISISAPEVVSSMSGESEGRIRRLFAAALDAAPCVLIIDEIDAITGKRADAQREMERRIVAQLLTAMDSLQPGRQRGGDEDDDAAESGSSRKVVLVIGATNRPDSLDPALRRAGRFDREIALSIPDESAREQILRVMTAGMRCSDDVDWREIAQKAVGYVGADLSALTKEAAVIAINRCFRLIHAGEEGKSAAEDGMQTEDEAKMRSDSTAASSLSLHASRRQHSLAELAHRSLASSMLRVHSAPLPASVLSSLSVVQADFLSALHKVQPSSQREGFTSLPDTSWNDVGALQGLHEELSLLILQPILNPQQFASIGLSSPAGVLLYGPPGCGKTLVAKAIASESGASFLSVKGPELLNLYVGESERAVRRVFERARSSCPCVIFFDELDALCPRRGAAGGGGDSGSHVSERVVNQLLTEMDGLQSRGRVFIIGATNRPDIIDPAMLRPGRLERLLYVPLPNADERRSILLKHVRRCPLDPRDGVDALVSRVAADSRSERLSGADCAALVREATIAALRERQKEAGWDVRRRRGGGDSDVLSIAVGWRHFDLALEKVKPSVSVEAERRYDRMSRTLRRARAALTDSTDDR